MVSELGRVLIAGNYRDMTVSAKAFALHYEEISNHLEKFKDEISNREQVMLEYSASKHTLNVLNQKYCELLTAEQVGFFPPVKLRERVKELVNNLNEDTSEFFLVAQKVIPSPYLDADIH